MSFLNNFNMLKKSKAQGLPVAIIIIAVLALIVLVVLISIFTGKLGDWSRDITEQEDAGKQAVSGGDETTTTESPLQPQQLPFNPYMIL
jgi:flagellar basal body-associated protein FliL